jgi:PAS domain-containing protein
LLSLPLLTMLSHNDFQQVHDHSAGGVIALDADGLIVYANPKAVTDFFPAAYLGQPATRFFEGPVKPVLADDEFTAETATVLISSALYTDEANLSLTYWFIRNISALKKKDDLLAYLNTATDELSRARNTREALAKLSALIVPKFATWFSN